ncbi:NAD(P)-binding protein [uncultured Xylophilus sp.]|uniref:oxidoreductase n=1 Tax=uncultured Xylophilus sp. TaxID=296832 RepID=UPI0025E29B3B|nr:NAD(P)-binding protein [uncultured Xylophilus sp.]
MTSPLDATSGSALLAPLVLSGRRLRNRVAHTSMSTYMARDGRITDALVRYYANRAEGGAALVVTEPISMAVRQTAWSRPRIYDDSQQDDFRRWADAVERHDCRLIGQIQDGGRARHEVGRTFNAIGPSRLPDDLSWSMPHALDAGEIRGLVDEFAQSSRRLQQCGFSGVELSAAHGHLFHQFFSPWANVREDDYGGSWENRVRFVAELVSAIRALCGPDFIVGLKLPGDDGVPGSIGPAEAATVADLLTRSQEASYVCFAQGAHAQTLEMHVPDRFGPYVPYLDLLRTLKPACNGVPLMALGRITDPAEAEGILARGEAELIGLGRALLADPAWLPKAVAGRTNDIRYCVSCNTCWDTIITHNLPIACINNPRVAMAQEVDWWPRADAARRRVVIVGSGVAGLEAAWVAAGRGHEVTVLGRAGEVGGKARLRARLPGGETLTSVYDYQFVAAQKAGVRFELGVEADAAAILALRPDTVVLATGSAMYTPQWIPADVAAMGLVPDFHAALWDLVRHSGRQPGTAVVYDMDHTEGTYAGIELLGRTFDRTVVLTPREGIAREVSTVARQGILRRFSFLPIEVVPLAEPVWSESFEFGALEYRNVYSDRRATVEDVAFLSFSTPRVPDIALLQPLRDAGIDVRLVGDARTARNVLAATADGHELGNRL